MPSTIHTAAPGSGELVLGRTLPSLLDEACQKHPNPKALNQLTSDGWQALSLHDFRQQAEELALGLRTLGLERGDRVCFYTHSDTSFCLADMACLIAGLVNVPIYLTHAESAIRHILKETEAKALVVSDDTLLAEFVPLLEDAPNLRAVVTARALTQVPPLPKGMTLLTFDEVRKQGRTHPEPVQKLKDTLEAQDLATIIYTSGTTGLPKGVMLSHENISSNAIASVTGLTGLKHGPEEVALSFLPLTHIFARMLQYGLMYYGISIYYSDPESVGKHLKEVKPTLFASVPRVLEKAYENILAAGDNLSGMKRRMFDWALEVARQFDVEQEPSGTYGMQLKLANRLVLSKWRAALGGNIRFIIVGGAALRADLVNLFGAAGIQVLQGYGLTETSPVIAYNRPERNKPGAVGEPVAGVEVRIADNGEILSRGPHIMRGYYQNEQATRQAIDEDGWFHTGDLGEMTADGFLRITGRLKNLFKLSTGKFVMPQPLEGALESETLIEHALVVGEGQKYCAALLFMNADALHAFARRYGLGPDEPRRLLEHEALQKQVCSLIRQANGDLPHWSKIKRVALVLGEITIDNDMLTPTMKVRRDRVLENYRAYVEALFRPVPGVLEHGVIIDTENRVEA
jgi:long-chain acyl-CoA synthetase